MLYVTYVTYVIYKMQQYPQTILGNGLHPNIRAKVILNNLKMNCLGVAKKKKSAAEKKKSIARHNMKKPEQQKQSEAKTQ